jgi:multidrug resistance protein, MATE family
LVLNVELEEAEMAAAVNMLEPPPESSLGMASRVLALAWPAVIEQTLNMTVGLVDTYLVGHLGASQLAAVGLGGQVVGIISVLIAAVAVGGTALVARHVGAGEPEMANRIVQQSLIISVIIGVACTVAGLAGAPLIMQALGAAPDVVGYGSVYLRVVSVTLILAAALFTGTAVLRGAGDTKRPLAIMLAVNAINIVVAYALINGAGGLPRLGVLGSALGAAVARGIGAVIVLFILWDRHFLLRLKGRVWRWDRHQMGRILNVGLPSGLEQMLLYVAQIAFAVLVARLGTDAYAAFQVSVNISSLAFMPGYGFALAATTLVGQYMGARQPRAAERSGYMVFSLSLVFMMAATVVMWIFAEQATRAFTADEAVVALGTAALRMAALGQPSLAATMAFAGALRGAGDTRAVMTAMGTTIWFLRVPVGLLLILGLGWGVPGVYVAQAVDFTGRGLWLWLRFRSGKWKELEV